jgi:hypothetical protein
VHSVSCRACTAQGADSEKALYGQPLQLVNVEHRTLARLEEQAHPNAAQRRCRSGLGSSSGALCHAGRGICLHWVVDERLCFRSPSSLLVQTLLCSSLAFIVRQFLLYSFGCGGQSHVLPYQSSHGPTSCAPIAARLLESSPSDAVSVLCILALPATAEHPSRLRWRPPLALMTDVCGKAGLPY